jgi:GTPase SAR1 family protein
MDSDYTLKILTIGESGVGKTCILLRYTDDKFVKTHLTTIGKINIFTQNRNRLQVKINPNRQ